MNKQMTNEEVADLNLIEVLVLLEHAKAVLQKTVVTASSKRIHTVYLLADEIKAIAHDAQFKGGK